VSGKPTFDEGYSNPEAEDNRSTEFDWEGLSALLGESPDMSPGDYARATVVLQAVLKWLVQDERGKGRRFGTKALRRLVAFLWAVDPAYFKEEPSLSELARKMGIHKVILSRHSAEVTKRFQVSNRFQHAHDWRNK
jgi:hypothetical protein